MNLFKFILNKLNSIHPKIEPHTNFKLNNLIEELNYNIINSSIEEISKVIAEELDIVEYYISNVNKGIKTEEIKYKNEINIKYMTEKEGNKTIFSNNFVDKNINNICLIINGKKSPLISEYYLKQGENNITIFIQNPLKNLSYMFSYCKNLYNIDELKYLNTENVINFSHMFEKTKISNIQALENWDTSKSENFQSMFYGCELLTNIKPLKNWNVSNCKDFSEMFGRCNISDLSPIKNWNVSKCQNLSHIFYNYENIADLTPIQNWDVSNCKNLSHIFASCKYQI